MKRKKLLRVGVDATRPNPEPESFVGWVANPTKLLSIGVDATAPMEDPRPNPRTRRAPQNDDVFVGWVA